MDKYLKDALKIEELENTLTNIAQDDGKDITDYSQAEVVHEAEYLLDCYNEGGHSFNEDLTDDDPDVRRRAKKEVKQLEKYIERYREVE